MPGRMLVAGLLAVRLAVVLTWVVGLFVTQEGLEHE